MRKYANLSLASAQESIRESLSETTATTPQPPVSTDEQRVAENDSRW